MTIHTLENNNLKVELINYGASIYNIYLKVNNNWQSVLSTPNNIDDFIKNDLNHGRIIGRTAGMLFKESLDDSLFTNTNNNIMHGGSFGLANNTFKLTNQSPSSITFETIDEGPKNGYIGNLNVEVTYTLNNDQLEINLKAQANHDTLVNLTSHPYFNLTQEEDLSNHYLYVNANTYKKSNQNKLDGIIVSLDNEIVDYRESKSLNEIISSGGLDHVYVINDESDFKPQSTLTSGNIELNVYSNYPSVVIYTHNRTSIVSYNNNKDTNNKYSGIAIEPQLLQGSVPVLKKDQLYNHKIIYEIKLR